MIGKFNMSHFLRRFRIVILFISFNICSRTPLGAIVKLTAANWLFNFSNQFSLTLYVMWVLVRLHADNLQNKEHLTNRMYVFKLK